MSGPGRAIPPGLDVEDYGVTADGQRFLFRLPTEDYRPPELELVLDWTALLGMQGPGEPAP